jgi:hypothetical protein
MEKRMSNVPELAGRRKKMIQQTRLLFPFTQGMSADALEQAVLLACTRHATLVPVSLIHLSERQRTRGPRLERVQQSKDFLEAVRCCADRHNVAIEQIEVVTSDVEQTINGLAQELACDGILLFVHGSTTVFLDDREARQVMQKAICRLYVFHLKKKEHVTLQVC